MMNCNTEYLSENIVRNKTELDYNVMKGTEYFVSSQTSVVISEENNIMVNSEELIGTADYMTL
jgi:hypothetical protein